MRVLYLTGALVFFDQLTKLLVKGISIPFLGIDHPGMDIGQSIHIFGEWFNITFIENPNMAFSLDIIGKVGLALFALAASIGLVIYISKHRTAPRSIRLALAFILAGAMGNLIDRSLYGLIFHNAGVFQGNVVDFIDLNLFTINLGSSSFRVWPIFNIADLAVTAGVILLIFATRIHGMPHETAAATTANRPAGTDTDKPQ